MHINIGYLLIIIFICVLAQAFLYKRMDRLYTRESAIPVLIVSLIGFTILCIFLSNLPSYHEYSSEVVEKTEEFSPEIIKKTQYKIIEKRSRNWFTGKWGDESTASFEEKVIKIDLVNSQNEPITMEEKYAK